MLLLKYLLILSIGMIFAETSLSRRLNEAQNRSKRHTTPATKFLNLYFLVDNNNNIQTENDALFNNLKTEGLTSLIPEVNSLSSNAQVTISLMACNNNKPQLVLLKGRVLTRNIPFNSRLFLPLDNLNCYPIEKGLSALNKIIDRQQDMRKLIVVFLRSNLLPKREEELKIQLQDAQQRGANLIFVDMSRSGSLRMPIFGSLTFGSPKESSGKFLRKFPWAQRDRVKSIIKCEFELLQNQNNTNNTSCWIDKDF